MPPTTASTCCGAARPRHSCFGTEDVERASLTADGPSPLRALMAAEQRAVLRDALAALPARYRVPLVLAVYQDLTYQEIATTLSVSRTHVAVLIFRAKQLLRLHLSRPSDTPRRDGPCATTN